MQKLKRNSCCCFFGKWLKKREKNVSILRLTKLPWVDEVQDRVRFQPPGRETGSPLHTPPPMKGTPGPAMPRRGIPEICAASQPPRALGRVPHSQTGSCVNFMRYLYTSVYIQSPSTPTSPKGDKVCHTDRNSCRITRSHHTTESYDIIISISPVFC